MLLTLLEITTEAATRSSAINFSWLFVKMIAALIVACMAAVVILKYAVPKLSFVKRINNDRFMKIISRVSVGPKQHLFLVKVAEKCILLGVTDHSVNKLSELENFDYEEKPKI